MCRIPPPAQGEKWCLIGSREVTQPHQQAHIAVSPKPFKVLNN